MKCILVLAVLVAPVAGRLLRQQNSTAHLSVSSAQNSTAHLAGTGGTCPNYLDMLRHEALNTTGLHPELKVVDVTRQGNNGFGPIFQTGLRYLLFDDDDSSGFVGVKCKIQSAVRCKASTKATGDKSCAGKPCEPDVKNPPLDYTKIQIGGAMAGLVASRGKAVGVKNPWGQAKPLSVAAIGSGAGTMPNYFLAAFPQIAVHAVDIDGAVMKAAVECFGLPSNDVRLGQHVEDGVDFFKKPGAYDLVMLDVAPMQQHFRENVLAIKSKMNVGGVLAVNGFAHEQEWKLFKQEAKKNFASVWIADTKYNQVLVAVAAGGDHDVANIPNTPTQQELVQGGVPLEAATWFTTAHWAKLA